jgi:hypothetical protein
MTARVASAGRANPNHMRPDKAVVSRIERITLTLESESED